MSSVRNRNITTLLLLHSRRAPLTPRCRRKVAPPRPRHVCANPYFPHGIMNFNDLLPNKYILIFLWKRNDQYILGFNLLLTLFLKYTSSSKEVAKVKLNRMSNKL